MKSQCFILSCLAVCSAAAVTRVQVSIYEESLCPACVGWFSGAFGPGTGAWAAYQTLGDGASTSIMDMDLFMWGNAKGDPMTNVSSFECQHGPVECYAMKAENCARGLYSNADYLSFIDCFDTTLIKTFPAGLPPGTVNMSFANTVVEQCAKAPEDSLTTGSQLGACTADGGDWKIYVNEAKLATPVHDAIPITKITWTEPNAHGSSIITNTSCPPPTNLIAFICDVWEASGNVPHPNCSHTKAIDIGERTATNNGIYSKWETHDSALN